MHLLFDADFSYSLCDSALLSLDLLLVLRRRRRGDAELDDPLTDDPVEYESQLCFRFLCAKSINRFIASGLWDFFEAL